MPRDLLGPLLPAGDGLPAGLTPEVLLWVSDYVDTVLAAADRRERAAFARGRAIGHDEGRRELEAEDIARFRLMMDRYRLLMRSPPYAQLERLRYGAGGRASWVIRRDDTLAERERLASARLEPGAGTWPRDLRRRAARRGDPDPFHLPHGPAMVCTACKSWGLDCPDEEAR